MQFTEGIFVNENLSAFLAFFAVNVFISH